MKYRKIAVGLLIVLILVQTQDLSRWFYLENQLAEAESNLISNIIVDLKSNSLEGKRIAFVYDYNEADELSYYSNYNSISANSFLRKAVNKIADKFAYTSTPEFKMELNRKHNQTNCGMTFLMYGTVGFDGEIIGPNYELKEYMQPFFFNFTQVTWDEYHTAQDIAEGMNSYPQDGYWKKVNDYYIVKIGI